MPNSNAVILCWLWLSLVGGFAGPLSDSAWGQTTGGTPAWVWIPARDTRVAQQDQPPKEDGQPPKTQPAPKKRPAPKSQAPRQQPRPQPSGGPSSFPGQQPRADQSGASNFPTSMQQPQTGMQGFNPAPGGGRATAGAQTTPAHPNYIDDARVGSRFRLRYDAMVDNEFPDRAEFFYPKCGCFRRAGIDRDAEGPPLEETGVDDYQELSLYLEYAPTCWFSAFVEAPYRWINPEVNRKSSGFSDMNVGFKTALRRLRYGWCEDLLTFQFRAYLPTGDGFRGLGTEHVSLEPALLMQNGLGRRTSLHSELRLWIPVGGNDAHAGEVLRYGIGLSHDLWPSCPCYRCRCCQPRLSAVAEFVGWTVLDGQKFNADTALQDADGDTIVNAKFGLRYTLNCHSLALSYGAPVTDEFWYRHVVRFEMQQRF